MKKLITLLLSISLIFTATAIPAMAEEDEEYDEYYGMSEIRKAKLKAEEERKRDEEENHPHYSTFSGSDAKHESIYNSFFKKFLDYPDDIRYHMESVRSNNKFEPLNKSCTLDYDADYWNSGNTEDMMYLLSSCSLSLCKVLQYYLLTANSIDKQQYEKNVSNPTIINESYAKIELWLSEFPDSKFEFEATDCYIHVKELKDPFSNEIIPEAYFCIDAPRCSFAVTDFERQMKEIPNTKNIELANVDLKNKTICGIKMGLVEKLTFEIPSDANTSLSDIVTDNENIKVTVEQVYIPGYKIKVFTDGSIIHGKSFNDDSSFSYIYTFSGSKGEKIYLSHVPSSYQYTFQASKGKLRFQSNSFYENGNFIRYDNALDEEYLRMFTIEGGSKDSDVYLVYYNNDILCTNVNYEYYMDSFEYNFHRNLYYLMADDQDHDVYDTPLKAKLPNGMLTPEQALEAAGDITLINYKTGEIQKPSDTTPNQPENNDKKQDSEENIGKNESTNNQEENTAPKTSETNDTPIDKLNELGLFKGTDNGYELDKTLTRAEMCALISRILVNAEDSDEVSIDYTDVSKNFWAYKDIAKLTANGIINGFEDNSFRPDEEVTAEQLAAMLTRATGHSSLAENTDVWYESIMKLAEDYGITKNVEFLENSPISRGQAVTMYYNALNLPIIQVESVKYFNGIETPNIVIMDGSSEDTPLVTLLSEYESTING